MKTWHSTDEVGVGDTVLFETHGVTGHLVGTITALAGDGFAEIEFTRGWLGRKRRRWISYCCVYGRVKSA